MADRSWRCAVLLVLAASLAAIGTDPSTAELDYRNAYLAKVGLPTLSGEQFATEKAANAGNTARFHQQSRFESGFVAPELVQKSGRSLVRARYFEPRLFFRLPGVTLEKGKGGRSHIQLSSGLWAMTSPKPVAATDMRELETLEAAAFAPDAPPPWTSWKKGDPVPDAPGGVCHAWAVMLERISPADAVLLEGHGCNEGQGVRARLVYGEKLALVALAAFPACRPANQSTGTFYALSDCLKTLRPEIQQTP